MTNSISLSPCFKSMFASTQHVRRRIILSVKLRFDQILSTVSISGKPMTNLSKWQRKWMRPFVPVAGVPSMTNNLLIKLNLWYNYFVIIMLGFDCGRSLVNCRLGDVDEVNR